MCVQNSSEDNVACMLCGVFMHQSKKFSISEKVRIISKKLTELFFLFAVLDKLRFGGTELLVYSPLQLSCSH